MPENLRVLALLLAAFDGDRRGQVALLRGLEDPVGLAIQVTHVAAHVMRETAPDESRQLLDALRRAEVAEYAASLAEAEHSR